MEHTESASAQKSAAADGAQNDFSGRVAVVFGCTGGIGSKVAERFYENGCNVALVGRNLGKLRRVFPHFTDDRRVEWLEAPQLNGVEITQVIERIRRKWGALHHLVHSVGIGTPYSLLECGEEAFEEMMNVNVKTAFLACKYAVPLMLESGGGTIVLISSIAGIRAAKRMLPYAASKAALLGMVRSIAVDYAPHIRINALSPGHIRTPMVDDIFTPREQEEIASKYPMGRFGSRDEAAEAVLFLSSGRSSWMTGQNLVLDGGRTIMY